MEEILGMIANLGFPIALSVYLLVRVEHKLDELTTSIHELCQCIEQLK